MSAWGNGRVPNQPRHQEQAQRDAKQRQVHDPLLPCAQPAHKPVGIGMTAHQQHLEEEH